jgi:EmrB/QacA subfamily drug resistance transporter
MTQTVLELPVESVAAADASRERLVLVVVTLSTILAPLNSTMIAVALPTIAHSFGVTLAGASWLVTGYLIAMASLQPVAGKLGDRFGRRKLMLGGLVYFGVVSLGAALSFSFPLLLFFRIQQGVAGAISFPNGSALLREIIPAERRASRFGLVGAVIGVAAALGPPLGGLLAGTVGWQAIFWVNLPIVLPALWLGWRSLPKLTKRSVGQRFDLVGAGLLSLSLVALAWLLTQSRRGDTTLLLPGVVVVTLMIVFFFVYEARHPDPVLQPRLFRHRSFSAATGAVAFSNFAMYTLMLTLPLYLTAQGSWSEVSIGLVLMALSAATVVVTPLGGRLADRFGRRWPTVAGMFLLTAGLVLLALNGDALTLPVLLAGLGVSGIGLGLSSSGMQTAALESAPARQAGVASGVFSTGRYLGSITGASLLAALIGDATAGKGSFTAVFSMVTAASVAAVLLSLLLHDRPGAEDG